ncbi:hypothetical protein P8452_77930 [Trifolium repens]|nr:hypothetical protein P8452_77930 [Trifolium repens]
MTELAPNSSFSNASKRLKTQKTATKAHRIYNKMCADIALDYYNNKNDTNFELVEDETLVSYSFNKFYVDWTRCYFKAKEDSCINDFFAEIKYLNPSGPFVTTCKILTQGETRVGLENYLSVIHPVVGYPGCHPFEPTDEAFKVTEPTYHPPRIYFNLATWTENRRIICKRIANRALDHYNKTNGTNFVLVDDDTLSSFAFSETWIHTCFNAVDSYIKQCNAEDSPIKLFFAEIKYRRVSMPVVTNCQIVDGETKVGCENCKFSKVIHPVVGYRGEFLDNTQIVEEDIDTCYKVYQEEFLSYLG